PLEAADVVWTIESLIDPRLAGLISAKSGSFAAVDRVEARDRLTVVVHMKRPDAGLLLYLSVDGQPPHTQIQRLQFNVVPDTITSALELQKGSADAASNVLTPDMVYALNGAPGLEMARGAGSNVWYLNFNVASGSLRDKR